MLIVSSAAAQQTVQAPVTTESVPAAGDQQKEKSTPEKMMDTTKDVVREGWEEGKEVSREAWDATKRGSKQAWEATKEVSKDAVEATKDAANKGAEIVKDGYRATKDALNTSPSGASATVEERETGASRQQDEDWALVHEVDIVLPQDKKVFGRVEVFLDRNSVQINGHEVTYTARVFRKGRSETETKEYRVSDCKAGRYRVDRAINLHSGKEVVLKNKHWRKPRQAHVVKLERYICENVCGIGYPDRARSQAANCLARPSRRAK